MYFLLGSNKYFIVLFVGGKKFLSVLFYDAVNC